MLGHYTRHRKSQAGIATILIAVLIALSATSIGLGFMASTRSAQQQHISMHAQAHAQSLAWTGAEALRQYLLTLDSTGLEQLTADSTFAITGVSADSSDTLDVTMINNSPINGGETYQSGGTDCITRQCRSGQLCH